MDTSFSYNTDSFIAETCFNTTQKSSKLCLINKRKELKNGEKIKILQTFFDAHFSGYKAIDVASNVMTSDKKRPTTTTE